MRNKEFSLPDTTGRHFTFTGRLLARVSSERDYKDFWTELELYATGSGMFVLHIIGEARDPNKSRRVRMSVVEEPNDLVDALKDRHANDRVSNLGLALLRSAAEEDERVQWLWDSLEHVAV